MRNGPPIVTSKLEIPDFNEALNPFDNLYLGWDEGETTVPISVRIPVKHLVALRDMVTNAKYGLDGNLSKLLRTAVMDYARRLASAPPLDSALLQYLISQGQLARAAFQRQVQYDMEQHLSYFELSLNEGVKKKKPSLLHEILLELRQLVAASPSPQWRQDLRFLIACSPSIQSAVQCIADQWSTSQFKQEVSWADSWFEWWQELGEEFNEDSG